MVSSAQACSAFILPTQSIGSFAFKISVMPSAFAICGIICSLGKKANNRQRLATAHSPTVPMFSIKLSCTAGSPPQVWWVAVRKYHYRPENIVARCPATDSSMRYVYRSFSFIAPPHARSFSRGTVSVVRIFFCQGSINGSAHLFLNCSDQNADLKGDFHRQF